MSLWSRASFEIVKLKCVPVRKTMTEGNLYGITLLWQCAAKAAPQASGTEQLSSGVVKRCRDRMDPRIVQHLQLDSC